MKMTAIVLAAGRGTRMGTAQPKQYLNIKGKPVLYYSLKAFEDSCVDEIILVTGEDEIEYCQENIIKKYGIHKVNRVVAGGKERFLSVMEGLKAIDKTDYVFIHDGARPFITPEEIGELSKGVVQYKACVAGMPVKDTIKLANESGQVVETPPRDRVWMVQTPQVFSYSLIKTAYEKLVRAGNTKVTDDAMVVEQYGKHSVQLMEASYRNIKITTPEDIAIAEALL